MQKSGGNQQSTVKSTVKSVLKSVAKKSLPGILIVGGVTALLAASLYFVTVDDGTYKEDDWSSTNYAASQYINNISVDLEEKKLTSDTSVQELWDKMIENGSRVNEYLDTPEDLAKLMRAEIVTQFPDIRETPDQEIEWDKLSEDELQGIIKSEDELQGIIKFVRANENNEKTTMIYTDPNTFQGYIDEYNETGSATAKKNALSHFTLKKSISTKSGILQTIDGVQMQVIEDDGKVTFYNGDGSAIEGGSHNSLGWDLSDGQCALKGLLDYAPKESVIYIETSESGEGSYANGKFFYVTDTGGGLNDNQVDVYAPVSKSELNGSPYGTATKARISLVEKDVTWEEYQEKYYNKTLGSSSTSDETDTTDTADTTNTNKTTKTEKVTATVTKVSGDGYSEEYTSSAGITYKHYKQYEGSYADDKYWSGTIHSSGCGPSSIAILASGLTNLNLTPGDIAAEMNSKYGYTSYETLEKEMESLGMDAEVTENPSAETIQDNLRNGKVMLVSVNSNTIFTGGSHIMALVDINTDGQVYICNPGSSTRYGWYDISEIMKGCKYIVATDAKATGIARATGTSKYVVEVASWTETKTTIETNDPEVEEGTTPEHYMTTQEVNYEEMVAPYTMPFDLLWAFMVVGEEKDFVFELADLVYNSDIEITIYDDLTEKTTIEDWRYNQQTKAVVREYNIKAHYGDYQAEDSGSPNHIDDPYGDKVSYKTKKTVVEKTNTINAVLTRANVWFCDYTNDFTYAKQEEPEQDDTVSVENQEYPSEPNSTSTDDEFTCDWFEGIKQNLAEEVKRQYDEAAVQETEENDTSSYVDIQPSFLPIGLVQFDESYKVEYYKKYVDIFDTITNKTSTKKHIEGLQDRKEKTEKDSKDPNFVTIFNKAEHIENRKNVNSVPSWLFEIIETNESTANMLDLIKYLLYKATGTSYGVESFDFDAFILRNLTSVDSDDYIVNIDMSSSDIVITDEETLKKAFSGYSGDSELQKYVKYFLEYQETYKVNAVFAAAVSIKETSGGRNGCATTINNWFNIKCTCGNSSHGAYERYSSPKESIEAFFKLIAHGSSYLTQGNYTVSSIGNKYCQPPENWIKDTKTYMTQMFNKAGISVTSSETQTEGSAVKAETASAQEFLDKLAEIDTWVKENYKHLSRKSGTSVKTFADAKRLAAQGKTVKVNCTSPAAWALEDLIGVKGFYFSGTTPKNLSSSKEKKYFNSITSGSVIGKNALKRAKYLKPGDIVSGMNPAPHTYVYAGNNMVYELGGAAAKRGYKNGALVPMKGTTYSGNTYGVYYILRWK